VAVGPATNGPPRVVDLVPADPRWAERFGVEAARVAVALGDVAVRIEHVGSTAVPGLAAKPVIDIQISVRSLEPMEAYRRGLERIGYVHRPDDESEHRFFHLDLGDARAFNVHVCTAGGAWERRHLAFRDHLRKDREEASRYEAVKRGLASRFGHDVDAYADAKTPYIRSVEARIGAGDP
jgi:GrpB-like predicted nucleotidyltransferase (UPF0157 family)